MTLFPNPSVYETKQQYSEMDCFSLAGWHCHYLKLGYTDECLKIESYVNNLPLNQRYWIDKLNYYKPIKKPLNRAS